jgi:hypothetical protein
MTQPYVLMSYTHVLMGYTHVLMGYKHVLNCAHQVYSYYSLLLSITLNHKHNI